MNYRKITRGLLLVNFLQLGLLLKHDSYQIFLAIVSVSMAFITARHLFKSKLLMISFFLILTIVFCQFSVLGRKAIHDPEFRASFSEGNPTSALVGDVIHGGRRIVGTVREIYTDGFVSALQSMNYRYLTVTILLLPASLMLLVKKEAK